VSILCAGRRSIFFSYARRDLGETLANVRVGCDHSADRADGGSQAQPSVLYSQTGRASTRNSVGRDRGQPSADDPDGMVQPAARRQLGRSTTPEVVSAVLQLVSNSDTNSLRRRTTIMLTIPFPCDAGFRIGK
jgi:hypothetical protein